MTDSDSPEILKAHCSKCSGERRHELLHRETVRGSELIDEKFSIDWADRYDMVKCCGCEAVALRHQHWFSEDTEVDGRPVMYTNFYPPAVSRREPRWLEWIDDIFQDKEQQSVAALLREIYVALYNDARRLAVMGTRALLEQMIVHKVGDNGSFAKNIEAFCAAGFISQKQKGKLETILEAGHAAIHRAFHPSQEDLNVLIDITESIVETVYAHEEKVKELKRRVPERK